MIDKRKAQPATQNTDLTEPASPGDVNEVNPSKAGCTELEQKPDLPEQLPDIPEQLPDLTRQRKLRSRTDSIIATAKKMLVSGVGPNEVACRLRLDPAVVLDLYNNSWNQRCRKVTPHNAWTCQKLAIQCFRSGAMLTEICSITDMPIFTIISMLEREGITSADLLPRMPSEVDHPLMVEYRRTVSRHKSLPCRRKPIQINPVRRTSKNQAGKPRPLTRPQP
ncbi:TPA: hypothetical protein ACN743_005732 [Klebsiella pneumoniae]